jgi:flavin-dependent dehydrogenase
MHSPTHNLGGAELTKILARGLAEHGVTMPDDGIRGWPAWGYSPSAPVSSPHVLTIGDAAGIDALTGEGIAVAMEHAIIAGDAIARAFGTADFGFAGYRKALRGATVGRELFLDGWMARFLYGKSAWRGWLSLVLCDPAVLELYAARVSGGLVLADHKLRLSMALVRHFFAWPFRHRRLRKSEAS